MGIRKRTLSGICSDRETEREIRNRALAAEAASEGVVLLKNDGILPLHEGAKVLLFGSGIMNIIKGGTGSGDVNVRRVVSLLEGCQAAGLSVINEAEAARCMRDYQEARVDWRNRLLEALSGLQGGSGMEFFQIFESVKMREVETPALVPEEITGADAVIYIVSRIAGEGMDRRVEEGDFLLTAKEREEIRTIAELGGRLVLLINTGGPIDLADVDAMEAVHGIVCLSQPGTEAGKVAADILTGKVNPSGKLTSTWPVRYEDIPGAMEFGYLNGDLTKELYQEGIYVGYRYFDTFEVKPLYGFGYGLSYTTFAFSGFEVKTFGNMIEVNVTITNTGNRAGREVAEVYASCPQVSEGREFRKLIGFAKTDLLQPGECETVSIFAGAKDLAWYSEEKAAFIVAEGEYYIEVGGTLASAQPAGILAVAEEVVFEETARILPPSHHLDLIRPDAARLEERRRQLKKACEGLGCVVFAPVPEMPKRKVQNPAYARALATAERMSNEELAALLMGEITKGQDNMKEGELVSTGIYVPGAAGETSCRFDETYGIPAISMADGPAGLRLMTSYDVDNATGLIYGSGLLSALQGGFLSPDYNRENVTTYHMYATAIPIGTMLAQTWDPELIRRIGVLVAEEMEEFGISWWLAPGMNIHRNPLCGRNFEYYSEDPLLTGFCAAAMTRGVQSRPGVGTTIKHYACNNMEDNRMHVDSVVSERALREIYLRGFELAVRMAQPMCLMTSYNMINGVPAANCGDLITKVLRDEWGFQGVVMTDWTTTTAGSATAWKCAEAGNDLIMPGNEADRKSILEALSDGRLSREAVTACAARLIAILWETLAMEEPKLHYGSGAEA